MDFSLFYFANDSAVADSGNRYRLLLEGAKFADRHGFTAVWTPERHFHRFGGLYPNPAVTGAALAAVTERIRIRAGSVVSPLHHPARIVEDWSVVDNLSGGRVGVSFASGWHPADFVLRPDAYAVRKDRLVETLQTVRGLWRGEPLSVTDGEGTPTEITVFPPPVTRELPCWLTTGGSADSFRTAGRLGVGVLTHLLGQDVDELAAKIALYREALPAEAGPGHVVLMLHAFLGDDRQAVRETVYEPLCGYLTSSFDLIAGSLAGRSGALDPRTMRASDIAYLVERGFDRFFDTSGLFGTVEQARPLVERLAAAGVDELACLIDFGVRPDAVLESLGHLDRLRASSA
ncbi:LLM class flavin-dependent oxidoreductase [Kitasatospora sp. NPDC097643]|uniref:LLM class flavin-dependent oxidoreductase n=1 Tax=Kitasatospora sp. NPDC097643 TaxID=3157230 RepID=UPI00331B58AE